ncbi:EAL domain-containing protein [Aquibacillus sediminis]|uniref:EAL domain-containing protein n=1 Tax=Aquibacillus sediminis TaxID=2574734 RepID=UPI001109F3BC|nr:EAL domain-containing protein [Aquibacillus sediminis]
MSIENFITAERFFHFFQPIYHLNGREKIGYEALLRSDSYPNPEYVFEAAKQANLLYALDSASIQKAVSSYQEDGFSKKDGKVFVNILPSTILHQDFPTFISHTKMESHLKTQQIVLEISETENITNYDALKKRILELKALGFQIAIDDFGKGFANIQNLIELEADYLKLDRYLAQDLHQSKQKQSFISFFVNYCEQNESQLILEGLETEAEMEAAQSLGISLGQGYFLCRPSRLKDIV